MRDLGVLVVDDSAYNRRLISEIVASTAGARVVGKASDGKRGLELALHLKPDLILLDLEMPYLDGFAFLRLLMQKMPTPVIVVSSHASRENVFRALELGAVDFVAKVATGDGANVDQLRSEISTKVSMVRSLSPSGVRSLGLSRVRGSDILGTPRAQPSRKPTRERIPSRLLLLAASTGGPAALVEIFRRIPGGASVAAAVVQHMPENFTRTFAQRLDRVGPLQVVEAHGMTQLFGGTGAVCPGGRCLEVLHGDRGLPYLKVVEPGKDARYVPSADQLFETAAKAFGDRCIGVVLTGMGNDGAEGVRAIKARGGKVFVEAPETAVVYGMPDAAIRTGLVDAVLPLHALGDQVAEMLRRT